MERRERNRVLEVADLRSYFHESLQAAIARQQFAVHDQTQQYLVNLLTLFARSEALFEDTPEGPRLRPLALMLADALETPRSGDRLRRMQRLGDVSLFVAGFFAASFARKMVDVDYHIEMGGRAYGSAGDLARSHARGGSLAGVFHELAAKFQRLVDALNELADGGQPSDLDVLRLYEIWLKTGSARARRQLLDRGVQPVPVVVRGAGH